MRWYLLAGAADAPVQMLHSPVRHTYLFVGLTPSERALLESLFALDRGHGDDMVPARFPGDAHLVVANGDDATVVERLRAEHPQALIVLVGRPAGHAALALPVLQRPLNLAAVAGVFSQLDWPVHLQSSEPADFGFTFPSSSMAPASQPSQLVLPEPPRLSKTPAVAPMMPPGAVDSSAFAPTTLTAPLAAQDPVGAAIPPAPHVAPEPVIAAPVAPMARVAPVTPAAVSARASWVHSELAPPAAPASAHEVPPPAPEVMVIVGALGERSHTLPRGIRRLGLSVQLVEAHEALTVFARQSADFVFLDQASLGDGLLALARSLVATRTAAGRPPHVVVVARRGSAFDRLRARLMGCTWMSVPIERERLAAFFVHRGRRLPG